MPVLAEVNGTAGLGPIGAMGVALAMISCSRMLPALLAIFGRRAFWPFVPGRLGRSARIAGGCRCAPTDETHGFWRRVGDRVARAPAPRSRSRTVAVLLVLCARPVRSSTPG